MTRMEFIRVLYEEEADGLYSFIKKFGIRREMAEDIVQETFCVAIKRVEELREHPNPVGWLYVTARYVMLKESKKLKKNEIQCSLNALENQLYDTKAETMLTSMEEDRICSVLTKEEYKILDLIYNKGYRGKEVAERLEINRSTLRVQIFRIRRKLQALIDEE